MVSGIISPTYVHNKPIEIKPKSFTCQVGNITSQHLGDAKVNVDDYAHLQGVELADASIVEGDQQNIDVFGGSDYYFDVVSRDVIRGESGPVAVSSMFGWILSGHTSVEDSREKFATTNLIIERPKLMSSSRFDIHSENDELSNALQKFWNIESLGVRCCVFRIKGQEHSN